MGYNLHMVAQLPPELTPYALVTIQEAAIMYHVSPLTIEYHLTRGNISGRKVGTCYRGLKMVYLSTLIAYYNHLPYCLPELSAS